MVGTICKRDILTHPLVTIHSFGWPVFLRALVARRNQTFLSLLVDSGAIRQRDAKVPKLVGQCVELELRAKRIYQWLARRFGQSSPLKAFFDSLVRQEQDHAELLQLCRVAASRGRWDAKHFDPWRDEVPRLQRQMGEAESSLGRLACPADALRLVIQIESSEVNRVFLGIVAASESSFVRKLRAFHDATAWHISYVCREIPRLEPSLEEPCREMRARYADQGSPKKTRLS